MPNRIIKESICTSENIDSLLPIEEVAFYRLLVNCDDYGCFDAREKVVKSRLFPLRDMTTEDVRRILDRLAEVGLILLYEVDGHPYLQMKTWSKHQQVRAKRRKYPSADESTCNQMISNDSKCARNPIQSESLSESESLSFIPDDDAKKIQSEHDRVLNAAEDAGFGKSNSVRAGLLKLYADYGLEKMLSGFESCVKHGVANIAYLEACLKGTPKKAKANSAQDYEQRDYSSVQDQAMKRQAERLAARGAGQ